MRFANLCILLQFILSNNVPTLSDWGLQMKINHAGAGKVFHVSLWNVQFAWSCNENHHDVMINTQRSVWTNTHPPSSVMVSPSRPMKSSLHNMLFIYKSGRGRLITSASIVMSQDWGGSASASSGRDQNEWEIPHRLDWSFCWLHHSENCSD